MPCLKMPTTVTLPVSISSVDTQTSVSGSIRWLPSLNADFTCICLCLTPCSSSVAGLPPGSRASSGKVMAFCSFSYLPHQYSVFQQPKDGFVVVPRFTLYPLPLCFKLKTLFFRIILYAKPSG